MHEDRADLIEELVEATRRLCAPQPGVPRDGYHSTDTETSDRESTNDILQFNRNIRKRRSRRTHREADFVARGQRIEELERQLQDSQLDLRVFQTRELRGSCAGRSVARSSNSRKPNRNLVGCPVGRSQERARSRKSSIGSAARGS